jgi:hypothetical protein
VCVCVCVFLALYTVSFLLYPIPFTKHNFPAHNHQLLGPVVECESPIVRVTVRPTLCDLVPAATYHLCGKNANLSKINGPCLLSSIVQGMEHVINSRINYLAVVVGIVFGERLAVNHE